MILSFWTTLSLILLVLAIAWRTAIKSNNNNVEQFSTVIAIIAFIAALIFGFSAGALGAFGYNTNITNTTTNFSKAITTDTNGVIIVYNNKPYLFQQIGVVSKFNSITNIFIYEEYSVLGARTKYQIRAVSPEYSVEDNTPK